MTTARQPAIGVLALQGDFDAHRKVLERCGAPVREVRLTSDLDGLAGLVIPGGESTVLVRLMREYGFDLALPRFVEAGGGIFGTCAGAILLARSVTSPAQWSLGLLDIDVERNGYGRQIDSFETALDAVDRSLLLLPDGGSPAAALPAIFIRAPRIRRAGPGVSVLAQREGEPVLVRAGRIIAATFHPELTPDTRIHRYFMNAVSVGESRNARAVTELREGASLSLPAPVRRGRYRPRSHAK